MNSGESEAFLLELAYFIMREMEQWRLEEAAKKRRTKQSRPRRRSKRQIAQQDPNPSSSTPGPMPHQDHQNPSSSTTGPMPHQDHQNPSSSTTGPMPHQDHQNPSSSAPGPMPQQETCQDADSESQSLVDLQAQKANDRIRLMRIMGDLQIQYHRRDMLKGIILGKMGLSYQDERSRDTTKWTASKRRQKFGNLKARILEDKAQQKCKQLDRVFEGKVQEHISNWKEEERNADLEPSIPEKKKSSTNNQAQSKKKVQFSEPVACESSTNFKEIPKEQGRRQLQERDLSAVQSCKGLLPLTEEQFSQVDRRSRQPNNKPQEQDISAVQCDGPPSLTEEQHSGDTSFQWQNSLGYHQELDDDANGGGNYRKTANINLAYQQELDEDARGPWNNRKLKEQEERLAYKGRQ